MMRDNVIEHIAILLVNFELAAKESVKFQTANRHSNVGRILLPLYLQQLYFCFATSVGIVTPIVAMTYYDAWTTAMRKHKGLVDTGYGSTDTAAASVT